MWTSAVFAQDTRTITVFSALGEEHQKRYGQAFQAANPGLRIKWVVGPTGDITEQLLSEGEASEGDAIFGLAATSMARLAQAGRLSAYRAKGLDVLTAPFRDAADPPRWVGMNAWVGAVCVNTIELSARGLPAPVTWKELVSPVYRDLIAMPSPLSSGTGFLHLSAWVQIMGEDAAWQFMTRLDKNIKSYTERGDEPCTQAARGQVALGISFAHRGVKSLRQGAPVQVLLPREGVGWDVGASAVLSGAHQEEAAKQLVDWSISAAANKLYNESYAVLGVQDLAQKVEGLPEDFRRAMIDNDLSWASQNRSRLLSEWRRRFDPSTAQ